MASNDSDRKPGDAPQREAERRAVRDARLAEALRANLKRRKVQTRGRETATSDREPSAKSPEPRSD